MLTEFTGDLFDPRFEAIAHGCNCQGKMGAGIAAQFRKRFPEMYVAYQQACSEGWFTPGMVLPWEAPGVVVYNLATQPYPGPCASLDAIKFSVKTALMDASQRGLPHIALPRIGAGIGGLDWADVRALLEELASSSPVEVIAVSLPGA